MSGVDFDESAGAFFLNVRFNIVSQATNEPHPSWVNRLQDILDKLNESLKNPDQADTVIFTERRDANKILFGYKRVTDD